MLSLLELQVFWEWCGIRYEPDQDSFKVIFPDGEWYNFGENWKMDRIEPPLDLNNLFKYAVPQLEDEIGYKETYKLLIRWVAGVLEDRYEELALALYQAIQKARHSAGKG